jgi:hypothetical protein
VILGWKTINGRRYYFKSERDGGRVSIVSLIELCLVKLAWVVLGLPSFDAGKGYLDLWIGNFLVATLLGTRFYRSREVARSARIASPGEFLIVTTAIASFLTLSGSTLLSLIFDTGIRVDPLPGQFVIGFVAGVSLFVAFILGDRFFLARGNDPSGRVVCFVPVFKNQTGEALLKLNLARVPLIDQERIVRYIKMKLPVPRAAIDDAVGIAKKNPTKDAGLDRGGRVLRRSEKSELSVRS